MNRFFLSPLVGQDTFSWPIRSPVCFLSLRCRFPELPGPHVSSALSCARAEVQELLSIPKCHGVRMGWAGRAWFSWRARVGLYVLKHMKQNEATAFDHHVFFVCFMCLRTHPQRIKQDRSEFIFTYFPKELVSDGHGPPFLGAIGRY